LVSGMITTIVPHECHPTCGLMTRCKFRPSGGPPARIRARWPRASIDVIEPAGRFVRRPASPGVPIFLWWPRRGWDPRAIRTFVVGERVQKMGHVVAIECSVANVSQPVTTQRAEDGSGLWPASRDSGTNASGHPPGTYFATTFLQSAWPEIIVTIFDL